MYDVVIVGAGPAGLFTAYELLEKNKKLKVAILDRGFKADKRVCPMNRDKTECKNCKPCGILSGYGGAGTFSDGKLNFVPKLGKTDLTKYMGQKEAKDLIDDTETIFNKFIASVIKDKDLYKNISALLKENNNLKDLFEEYLDKYKETEGSVFSYSTYYYGLNQIIQYDFHSYLDNFNIMYKEDKNIEKLIITKDDNTILDMDINTSNNDKSYTFSGNLAYLFENTNLKDNEIFKLFSNDFSGTYKDKSLELIINREVPLKINFTFTNGVLDSVFKYNINLKVANIIEEKEEELFNLVSEIEFIFDKKIDVEVTNSTLITVDSEEEKAMNDLLNNNPIYQLISNNMK